MPVFAAPAVRGLAAGLAGAGVASGIGRGPARQLARRELARSMYQPSFEQRVLDWLGKQLTRLFHFLNVSVPGGWWGAVCLIAVAVAVAAVVMIRIRPAAAGRRTAAGGIHSGTHLSARDHRQLAERCATQGDYSGALVELVRAIAAELEERQVLPARPGRTADEFAAEAGQALPAHTAEFAGVARLFDDVMYGGRAGTAGAYQRAQRLDTAVRASRPVTTAQPAGAGAPP